MLNSPKNVLHTIQSFNSIKTILTYLLDPSIYLVEEIRTYVPDSFREFQESFETIFTYLDPSIRVEEESWFDRGIRRRSRVREKVKVIAEGRGKNVG